MRRLLQKKVSELLIGTLLILMNLGLYAQKGESSTVFFQKRIKLEGVIFSSIARTDHDHVVICSHNRYVYFFDKDGELINTFKSGKWIHSTPKLFSNHLIGFGSYDGYFYFFDENGKMLKRIEPGGTIFSEAEEFGPEYVFGMNHGKVVFYNRKNDQLSYVKLGGLVHGTPTALPDSQLVIGTCRKRLYFIDQNHSIVHTFKTGGWIMHSKPQETFDRTIVFGSYDHYLYGLSEDGTLRWKFKSGGKIHCSPLQTPDSVIVFGAFDGNVYFLSPKGELIKKDKTGGKIVSSPVMVNDSILAIGSFDKKLYFYSTKGKRLGAYDLQGKLFSTPVVLSNGRIVCCTVNGMVSFVDFDSVRGILPVICKKSE